ncbi:hypothetical protein [Nonomuraea basaltis]|uniref:hypothetical protein n=1 Tax=Nonomuraea basaltis TaxID=2495887 RepID=UPI00110C6200|nr:hypothetical protein [Nonomuraea basaltis]TMR92546.1 hypothetical protein EJK15_43880 [Nonomuraea basaltis]
MNAPDLDGEDIAILSGCWAFIGTLIRNLTIAALLIASVATSGVLSGVLWSATAAFIAFSAIRAAGHSYRARRPRSAPTRTTIKTSR